jgi:hypothetical protein
MKAQFLTKLRVEHLAKKWWMLTEPLVYYSALLERDIVVPAGFVTDFASVPRIPIAYWLFGSRANAPAVIHDRLYRWGDVPRLTADRVFNEAMRAEGKWFTTRWPMTAAVMAFGWWAYKPVPGCLDWRGCKPEPKCIYCDKYYGKWRDCIRSGYHPALWREHE